MMLKSFLKIILEFWEKKNDTLIFKISNVSNNPNSIIIANKVKMFFVAIQFKEVCH